MSEVSRSILDENVLGDDFDFSTLPRSSQLRENFLRLCQNKAAVAGLLFFDCFDIGCCPC